MSFEQARPRAPLIDPPFWRALTPVELAHYGDVQAEPSTPTPGAGWMPAAFRAFLPGCGLTLIHGWVCPPFALHQAFVGLRPLGQLSHLPTGNIVGTFWSVPEAAFAQAILSTVTDWSAVTVEAAHTLIDPVVDAIEDAGFAHLPITVGSVAIPVWRRGALS